ncbi:MAG: ribulose phosphate epimerase [Myxococcales bacterium]|nr:ribulose phosphate epimerase [Myxococcales bacterium]
MNRTSMLVLLGAMSLACGTVTEPGSSDTNSIEDDDGGTTTTGNGTDPSVSGTSMTTTGVGSSSGGMDDESTGAGFLLMPDGVGPVVECDVWAQDCPDGEKCMPWANDGSNSWNATRCSEVADNPGQVGDECTVEGSGVSGIDDCDVGSMCYYVDPETNVGTCVAFCEGSQAAPMCEPGFLCSIANNGVLILCRRECDPLLQDCQGSAACLPAAGAEGFVCIVDASGESGAPGDPCEYLNSCDPGLFCAVADAVPNCQGSGGCCSEFCDLTDPMPDAACTQAGQVCEPWFEMGSAPPDLVHVGACALPM